MLNFHLFVVRKKVMFSSVLISLILKENAGRKQNKSDGSRYSALRMWTSVIDIADLNTRQLLSLE